MTNKAYNAMKKLLKLPFLPILLGPLLLFFPLIVQGKALFWGTPALQFVPWWDWSWKTLTSGELPLWNPLVGMGAPLLANYQSALFYPPHWVYFLLHQLGGTPWMAWGQAVMVLVHLVWAGIGMAVLIRKLGGGTLAQAVSGLCFSLSGYLVARAGFLSINAAAAWIPWILAGAFSLVKSPAKKHFAGFVLVQALQLFAGHAQTAYYTILLTGLWVILWSVTGAVGQGWVGKVKKVIRDGGLYLVALCASIFLSAIQLLPTLEYLLQSQRATAAEYDFVVTYSFWPWRFLTLIAPDLFGNPALGNYWGYATYWEDAMYIGLLPFLLACGLILTALKRQIFGDFPKNDDQQGRNQRLALFFTFLIVIAVPIALGKNTPIFPWLYRHVPTFNLFQAPTRISIWIVLALSILAGLKVEQWHRPRDRGLYWTRLATAGAFAVMIGAGLGWILLDAVKPTFIRAAALAGFWGVGAGMLSLTSPLGNDRDGEHGWWRGAVVGWILLDLVVAGWGLNPGVDLEFYRDVPSSSARQERLYLPSQEEYELKFEQFLRFDSFCPQVAWSGLRRSSLPNLNMLDGLAMVNNFDPLVPGRYHDWMTALDKLPQARRVPLLKLMGVGSVGRIAGPGQVQYSTLPGGRSTYHWLTCDRAVDTAQQALNQIMYGDVNLGERIILETDPQKSLRRCRDEKAHIEIREQTPTQSTLLVTAEQPGWLLRSTVWYPGWKAEIDGQETHIYRGDYLFQAIQVPQGEHTVRFTYQPWSFRLGSIVSAMTLLLGLVWYAWERRRKS